MKKQTFNSRNSSKLTEVIKSLIQKKGYIKYTRPAISGSGDDVHVLKNPKNGFVIEFCTKIHPTLKSNYVNWARVYGKEETVNKFQTAVNYYSTMELKFTVSL